MKFNSIFSMPVSSRKRQVSMRREFIIFSLILFLLIFVFGSGTFVVLMGRILHDNAGKELSKILELERFKLEASVNSEIAIVVKIAASPLLLRYFLDPSNPELEKMVIEDIDGYRSAFASHSLFWVNDANKKFYMDGEYAYTVDPDDPEHYWYNMTLYETEKYNFNINYNPALDITNLWINVTVFDSDHKPIGILGSGMNLSDFLTEIYRNYSEEDDLYFFNAAGEITGAMNTQLVSDKIRLDRELGQTGEDILNGIKYLRTGEIKYFKTKDFNGVAAFGAIPALDWYVTAIYRSSVADSLKTGMAILFGTMMLVIFSIFAVFNIFVAKMLEPINRITKKIIQLYSEWDISPQNEVHLKDEIGTLGEFLDLTVIDQLTGICNRRFMDGSLKKIIKSLSRTGGNLSVLMVDIDFFKKYNDTYGHDMGDKCLIAIADVLMRCTAREDDFAARYGGEEFVVVLPNTEEEGARMVADRIIKEVYECCIPHETSEAADFVTVSVGGTTGMVRHSQKGSDYTKGADVALYKSKKNGRNQYTFERMKNEEGVNV
jgi:methyl-accepting chemotaxis protein